MHAYSLLQYHRFIQPKVLAPSYFRGRYYRLGRAGEGYYKGITLAGFIQEMDVVGCRSQGVEAVWTKSGLSSSCKPTLEHTKILEINNFAESRSALNSPSTKLAARRLIYIILDRILIYVKLLARNTANCLQQIYLNNATLISNRDPSESRSGATHTATNQQPSD